MLAPIPLNLTGHADAVHFGPLSELGSHLSSVRPEPSRAPSRALLVADARLGERIGLAARSLARSGWQTMIHSVPSGERSKSFTQLRRIYDTLADLPADRRTLVVAFGGGVVGDLAGFAAATFHRGLPWLPVPSTLLAMVDACIGGKTAINHPAGKNLIGAFHQPISVYIDANLLSTLPKRHFAAGMAEVIKYAVMLDRQLFDRLEQCTPLNQKTLASQLPAIIHRCCQLKAAVVAQDVFDTTGQRAKLNFGHTVGHALEALGNYRLLLHGEAVALGMIAEARLACKLGLCQAEDLPERLLAMLASCGLPVRPPVSWSVSAIMGFIQRDKKTHDRTITMALPQDFGSSLTLHDVPLAAVRQSLLLAWT